MHPDFEIRRVLPGDTEFILKTWGREMEAAEPHFIGGRPACPKRLFFDEFQDKVMRPLMQRAQCRLVVPKTDSTYIAGFYIGDVYSEFKTAVVHFAYTRPPFRRLGFARAALQSLGYEDGYEVVATHWTKHLNRFDRPDLILNRLALYHV